MKPLIIIQKSDDLYHVNNVSSDPNPARRPTLPARLRPIQGQAAELLYMAIAGHRFGTGPDRAEPGLAFHARAMIARYAHLFDEWLLANVVILHFGQWYQPWLGLTKIDAAGQPIKDDPDYDRRLKL